MPTSQASAALIALVEDDPMQQAHLKVSLKEAGFKVCAFSTRTEAETALQTIPVDLLVSDIILAGEQDGGFELAKTLQHKGFSAPIIFLSERQSEYDIMLGHELGAVDYLPKPFNLNILIAKINNLLKITQKHSASPQALHLNALEIDPENYRVKWKGQPIHLTATEFEMLHRFAQAGENKVVTYDQLKEATQGVVERNTINTHICRIRNAFRKVDPDFNMIHNEYGRGYSWRHKDAKADQS